MLNVNKQVSNEDIKKYLAHRYPMLLIDRVIDYTDNHIHVIKNVTANEPQLQGHFPQYAIFPGALIIESMAQASGLLFGVLRLGVDTLENPFKEELEPENSKFLLQYLVAVDKCRFRQLVTPGDTMHIHVTCGSKCRHNMMRFDCKAFVEDKLVSEANIMCSLAK